MKSLIFTPDTVLDERLYYKNHLSEKNTPTSVNYREFIVFFLQILCMSFGTNCQISTFIFIFQSIYPFLYDNFILPNVKTAPTKLTFRQNALFK